MNEMQRMVFDEDHMKELQEKRKVEMEKTIETIFLKLENISKEIGEIGVMCPIYGDILFDFYEKSVNLMRKVSDEKVEKYEDLQEDQKLNDFDKIKTISNIIGFSIQDFLNEVVQEKLKDVQSQQTNFDKEVEKETLEFITSDQDLDDYERFIKQNKVKENLNFLSENI